MRNQFNYLEKLKMKKYDTINRISAIVIFTLILSGCMVGPNFQKVEIDAPEEYRFQNTPTDTTMEMQWQNLFRDPTLITLIDSALRNNFDAQIAASKIQESRAYLGYAKADMYPSFSYGGSVSFGNSMGGFPSGQSAKGSFSANANLNWELVFWGKYRRATESAKAELAATEYGYSAIQISLIAEVANTYYLLLDYRNRLETAKRTLATRSESFRIIKERFEKGIVPEIDLNQSQIQEAFAAGVIPVFER
jgi:multidrug efflux system outer membrane protein